LSWSPSKNRSFFIILSLICVTKAAFDLHIINDDYEKIYLLFFTCSLVIESCCLRFCFKVREKHVNLYLRGYSRFDD